MNLFGSGFGDYPQAIVMKIYGKAELLKSTKNEIIFFSDIHKVLLFTICIVYNEFLRQKLFWESSFRKVVYIGKRKKLFN